MKLQGIRVVDLSLFLPGPYLTKALADHGAEVIKVEPPGEGDPVRHLGLSDGPSTDYFRNLNPGKKSVVLNLKDPKEREALHSLCDGADVFVESFRPGVVKRLGFDYAALAARNPRLVYCSISGFGQDGPYRDRPSHDLGVEAVAGALSVSQCAEGHPAIPAIAAADMVAALQGLAGILMALLRREKTGQGDFLDISMLDCVFSATANLLGPPLAEDRQQVARHERTTGGGALYQIYETADGRHIALSGQEMKFVHNLLGALGRPAEDLPRGAARPAAARARHGAHRQPGAAPPRRAAALRARAGAGGPARAHPRRARLGNPRQALTWHASARATAAATKSSR